MTLANRPSSSFSRTALVLSAGAVFGAYQAGAWKALAPRFAPDAVVGASIGSLNGWMIAGGISPDLLIERWLRAEAAGSLKWRWPRNWLDGWLSAPHLEQWIREMHGAFTPKAEVGVVTTRLRPFGPELARAPDITWQCLAASCAMPLLFPHYRLNGVVHGDGGLTEALPLWAAREFGCGRVLAVNCLAAPPFPGAGVAKKVLRAVSRYPAGGAGSMETLMISPRAPLGGVGDFLRWKRENVERWIAQGFEDARAAIQANPAFFESSERSLVSD